MKYANQKGMKIFDLTRVFIHEGEPYKFNYTFIPHANWVGNNPYKFLDNGVFAGEFVFADGLRLKGQIIIPMEFVCSRCGTKFKQNLFLEVDEVLFDTENEEHFSYSKNKVNLQKIVEQLVISQIPTQVLCSDNCLGLCPYCGKNLNEGKCGCHSSAKGDNPFSKLIDKFN